MLSIIGHLRVLRKKYKDNGIGGLLTDIKKYARFRWNRLFLHSHVLSLRKKYLRLQRFLNPNRISDADPFKIIYVNPAEIQYRVTNVGRSSGITTGNVGADWGRVSDKLWELQPIEKMSRYKLLKDRYINGKEWAELDYDSTSGIRRDKLYETIKKEGYKSQLELQAVEDLDPTLPENYTKAGVNIDRDVEVGVGIDHDGSIVFVSDGMNRLCIAKLLNIDKIPVQVRVRHESWQAIRDTIRDAESTEHLTEEIKHHLGHPDLQDITPC